MTILEQKKTGFFERQMSPPPQQRKFKLQLHDSIHVPENFHPASNKITDLYHETNSFPPQKKMVAKAKKKSSFLSGRPRKLLVFFGFLCVIRECHVRANQHRRFTVPTLQPVQDTQRYPTAWHPTVKVMVG